MIINNLIAAISAINDKLKYCNGAILISSKLEYHKPIFFAKSGPRYN